MRTMRYSLPDSVDLVTPSVICQVCDSSWSRLQTREFVPFGSTRRKNQYHEQNESKSGRCGKLCEDYLRSIQRCLLEKQALFGDGVFCTLNSLSLNDSCNYIIYIDTTNFLFSLYLHFKSRPDETIKHSFTEKSHTGFWGFGVLGFWCFTRKPEIH